MSVKILHIHKRDSLIYNNIQDKSAIDVTRRCFALADGTTQSFDSGRWAEIITQAFIEKPLFDPGDLLENLKKRVPVFKSQYFELSPNPALAAVQKNKIKYGATATFLGVQVGSDNCLRVIACGDTNIFHISKNGCTGFPYNDVEALDTNRSFINTEKLIKGEIELGSIKTHVFSYQPNDIFILATDALSRMVLRDYKVLEELKNIKDFTGFHTFSLNKWDRKILEEDDLSAIIITMDSSNTLTEICPPGGFSFPIPEPFIPSIDKEISNPMEMERIRKEIRELNTEVTKLKKDTRYLQKFGFLLLAFLLVSLLLNGVMVANSLRHKKQEDTNSKITKPAKKLSTKKKEDSETIPPDSNARPLNK